MKFTEEEWVALNNSTSQTQHNSPKVENKDSSGEVSAVEWLINQIHKKQYGDYPNLTFENIFDQAKEMEKQQIIDAWDIRNQDVIKSDGKTAEHYYTSTYGSKGSDEPIELLCSTVEVGKSYLSKGCGIGEVIEYDSIIQMFKVKYQSGNTEYVNLYGLATHVNNITATDFDLMLDKPISSQTEISDEEIEKGAENAWSDYEYEEGNLYSTTFKGGWKLAIKWYREQLKTNNNDTSSSK